MSEGRSDGDERPTDGDDRGTDGDDRATMADVSHANPYTGETMGDVFRRGPAVADGGVVEARSGRAEDGSAGGAGATMADVDHTPPNRDVNDVWSRGHRGSAAVGEPGAETAADADVTDVPTGDDV